MMRTPGRPFAFGAERWILGSRTFSLGILNATPDSFSDGGMFGDPQAALAQAERLVAEGADMLDVGAESTRPGAHSIDVNTEWDRLDPVLRTLTAANLGVPLSIDTQKAEIARRAIAAGVSVVNDVSGLRDPEMVDVLASSGVGYVLMYHPHEPLDPVADVSASAIADWLQDRLAFLADRGVSADHVLVDPGLGFAYGVESNWTVLAGLESLQGIGAGVLVGPSRKRFLGAVTGREASDRDGATAALCALLVTKGVDVVRVHNVALVGDALRIADRWAVGNG